MINKLVKFLVMLAIIAGGAFASPTVLSTPGMIDHSFAEAQMVCIANAIYYEARGEPDKGKRAVYDTILHRVQHRHLSPCQVVAQKQQFPWYKKLGLKPLTAEHKALYDLVLSHPKVLNDSRFVYFNRAYTPGTSCVRIGHHKFCKEEKLK